MLSYGEPHAAASAVAGSQHDRGLEHQVGDQPGPDANAWAEAADRRDSTWWTDYSAWLTARAGRSKRAPRLLGNRSFPRRAPAPGAYVLDK
jgi:polyhydroxyalkanoate synthase